MTQFTEPNLTPNMRFLNYDDVQDTMVTIENILKELNVDFKWVEGSLSLYPDNYLNTFETSKHLTLLYIHNWENFDPDDEYSTFEIEFQLHFKDITDLKNQLRLIKNGTLESNEWNDVSSMFLHLEENRKKEQVKKDFLSSLTFEDINKNIKHIKKTIKFLENTQSNDNLINNLKYEIQKLRELKK